MVCKSKTETKHVEEVVTSGREQCDEHMWIHMVIMVTMGTYGTYGTQVIMVHVGTYGTYGNYGSKSTPSYELEAPTAQRSLQLLQHVCSGRGLLKQKAPTHV